ncbi:MAG: M24 family metallopeptidase [Thermaerobacter sp.]|nr:M24 family metallopeptidase [Thermaerobacter sp.]
MPFSREEYEARNAQMKARMAQAGCEVLIVADPANMNYLTGYDGWSFYVPQVVVLALDLDEPLWIGRQQDASGARLTCWMATTAIEHYPDDYVQSSSKHPMDYVADVLRRRRLDRAHIAVELDAYYFTALAGRRLEHALSQARFQDGSLWVNRIRIIKSEAEIVRMRRAAAIADETMATAIMGIAAGVRECDVAGEIVRAQLRGTPEFGGDYPAIVPLMPSGARSGTPHLSWTDRRYAPGDALNIEIAGCYERYHVPLSRSVVIGPPSPNLSHLADVVVEGVDAALAAVKPGVACETVEAAWQAVLRRHGYSKESRVGYSVGLNYPPDWGEHTASLRPGDDTELVPNMTFHLIPGMWLDGYGLEISETFRVTATGCETFTQTERRLFIK